MISSLAGGLRILDLLVMEGRPLRLSEIARSLELSKSGLHSLLATLVECGYADHLQGGFYQLGLKAWRIANAFPTADLVHVASPVMEALVRQVGEGCILGVLNGVDVSYLHLVESRQVVRVHAQVGERIAAHATSTGLALLAFQDEALVQRLMPHSLEALSSKTITDHDALWAELGRTRARGYSVNRGGWHDDVGGIAVPVMGEVGPIAALCISLPLFRMTKGWIRRMVGPLQEASAEIGRALNAKAIERRVTQ
jgi:IclR family KDG regulon transcriptional repressor